MNSYIVTWRIIGPHASNAEQSKRVVAVDARAAERNVKEQSAYPVAIVSVSSGRSDAEALDALREILSTGDEPWPSGADFLDWCGDIVRSTGRRIT